MSEKNKKLKFWIAELVASAGCGCCRDYDRYNKAKQQIGKLLDYPEFEEQPGAYNFYDVAKRGREETTWADEAMECPYCKEISLVSIAGSLGMFECLECHREVYF